jgi:glycosyltransferase A (GT-A) superfamily protein (DUF2064 family)
MAKAPRLGFGKTRLAAEIGRVEAWRVNRAMQARTLRAANAGPWRTLLCVTPDCAVGRHFPGVWPGRIARLAQGAGGLGERLTRALARRRRVAVIGVDCPEVTPTRIASAFVALRCAPFAIGPAADGGFWILAARSGAEAALALAGVRWSTRHAAKDVMRNVGPHRIALLEQLQDVDTAADLRRWRQRSAIRASSGV